METLLPGLHHAPNVHPFFVHLPLALWLAAMLFAVTGAVRARDDLAASARWLLYGGTLAAVPTLVTGWQAMETYMNAPIHDLIHVHMYWMFTATGIAVAACVVALLSARAAPPRITGRWPLAAALIVTVAVSTLGADRGALLVYRWGLGTRDEVPPASGDGGQGHGHGGAAGHGHDGR